MIKILSPLFLRETGAHIVSWVFLDERKTSSDVWDIKLPIDDLVPPTLQAQYKDWSWPSHLGVSLLPNAPKHHDAIKKVLNKWHSLPAFLTVANHARHLLEDRWNNDHIWALGGLDPQGNIIGHITHFEKCFDLFLKENKRGHRSGIFVTSSVHHRPNKDTGRLSKSHYDEVFFDERLYTLHVGPRYHAPHPLVLWLHDDKLSGCMRWSHQPIETVVSSEDKRFHVIRRLFSGGESDVLLAYDSVLEDDVVLRALSSSTFPLSSQQHDKLRKEYKNTPSCLGVINMHGLFSIPPSDKNADFVVRGGLDAIPHFVLSMEYVSLHTQHKGKSTRPAPALNLAEYVEHQGQLSLKQIARISRELAEILRALQQLEPAMAHADLKPQNILITRLQPPDSINLYWIRLIDFGLSRQVGHPPDSSQSGYSPSFAPREVLRDPYIAVDEKADINSFGILLYWMLTGMLPYPAGQLNTTQPPALPSHEDLPEDLRYLLLAMLAVEPEQRPHIEEIVLVLEAWERTISPRKASFERTPTPLPVQSPLLAPGFGRESLPPPPPPEDESLWDRFVPPKVRSNPVFLFSLLLSTFCLGLLFAQMAWQQRNTQPRQKTGTQLSSLNQCKLHLHVLDEWDKEPIKSPSIVIYDGQRNLLYDTRGKFLPNQSNVSARRTPEGSWVLEYSSKQSCPQSYIIHTSHPRYCTQKRQYKAKKILETELIRRVKWVQGRIEGGTNKRWNIPSDVSLRWGKKLLCHKKTDAYGAFRCTLPPRITQMMCDDVLDKPDAPSLGKQPLKPAYQRVQLMRKLHLDIKPLNAFKTYRMAAPKRVLPAPLSTLHFSTSLLEEGGYCFDPPKRFLGGKLGKIKIGRQCPEEFLANDTLEMGDIPLPRFLLPNSPTSLRLRFKREFLGILNKHNQFKLNEALEHLEGRNKESTLSKIVRKLQTDTDNNPMSVDGYCVYNRVLLRLMFWAPDKEMVKKLKDVIPPKVWQRYYEKPYQKLLKLYRNVCFVMHARALARIRVEGHKSSWLPKFQTMEKGQKICSSLFSDTGTSDCYHLATVKRDKRGRKAYSYKVTLEIKTSAGEGPEHIIRVATRHVTTNFNREEESILPLSRAESSYFYCSALYANRTQKQLRKCKRGYVTVCVNRQTYRIDSNTKRIPDTLFGCLRTSVRGTAKIKSRVHCPRGTRVPTPDELNAALSIGVLRKSELKSHEWIRFPMVGLKIMKKRKNAPFKTFFPTKGIRAPYRCFYRHSL